MISALRSLPGVSLLHRITPRGVRVFGACSLLLLALPLTGCESDLAKNPMFGVPKDDEPSDDDSSTVDDAGPDKDGSVPSTTLPDAASDASAPALDADVPDPTDAATDPPEAEASTPVDPCPGKHLEKEGDPIECSDVCTEDCGLGEPCEENDACESGLCDEVCLAAGCANEHLDDNESDVDCGGVCSKGCDDEKWCQVDLDCKSHVCGSDHLCSAAKCTDETLNGGEVGIDCGSASGCGLCENGASCVSGADCESETCVNKQCAPPTCNDEVQNGDETDLNCGGECPACEDDATCRRHSDCESGRCENDGEGNLLCHYPECDDKVRNGDESDIDCGGPCDRLCILGKRCHTPDDCELHACGKEPSSSVLVCLEPSCDDGTKNGSETDIDCGGGGDCEPCIDDKDCEQHSDCESNNCDGTCVAPTCEDERKNNDETAPDCGGEVCDDRCDAEQACAVPEDCMSGLCGSELCLPAGAGSDCRTDEGCLSGQCTDERLCAPSTSPGPCRENADCATEVCAEDGTCQRAYVGGKCGGDDDCASNNCLGSVCGPGITGDACQGASDCATGRCVDQLCAPLDLVTQSNGNFNGTTEIAVDFTLSTGSVTVPWSEIAVLYFFNFADPPTAKEVAYANMGQHYESTGANRQCVGVTNTDWIFVWRSNAGGNVGGGSTYTIKLNNKTSNGVSQPLDPTNDYSYRAGAGATTKLVICRKVGDLWYQVQNTGPDTIAEPCQYVTPDCNAVNCDTL